MHINKVYLGAVTLPYSNYSLNNMDINIKTYLTNKLVQMMKTVFEKIDLRKVTSGNIQKEMTYKK